jgi:hypothetical protein
MSQDKFPETDFNVPADVAAVSKLSSRWQELNKIMATDSW